MQSIELSSPAKTNLFLKINHKREDGFHDLSTLMVALSLSDTLSIEQSNRDTFTCSDQSLSTGKENLVIRARDLYRAATKFTHPLSIHLEKRIPHRAGLGGGSSNAATTLYGLNKLAGSSALEMHLLVEMGALLGSDVPFFFSQGTALCTGRGEVIKSQKKLPFSQQLWVIKPGQSLATQGVYKALDLSKLSKYNPDRQLQNWHLGQGVFFNDLEPAAMALMPELAKIKERIEEHGFKNVMLSGSGSSFIATSEKRTSEIAGEIAGCTTYRVKMVKRDRDEWY